MENLYQTPILLLIFNRMNTTVRVFEKIKEQKPRYLFIASDGPREGKENEQTEVDKVRNYVLDQIDWECELKTLFRDQNLGCGVAPYTAITWFFEQVDKGIILEDDCLPLPGFFNFCEEMLNYYKDDERIYEISGHNLQGGKVRGDGSYYFSNYGGIWGWATWARAWKNYDYRMTNLSLFENDRKIEQIFEDKQQQKFWSNVLYKASELGSWWDYQWLLTIWSNGGLCIVPNRNLVENIGFDQGGTHTHVVPQWYKKATKGDLVIDKIVHPKAVKVNIEADNLQYKTTLKKPNLIIRGFAKIKSKFK